LFVTDNQLKKQVRLEIHSAKNTRRGAYYQFAKLCNAFVPISDEKD
jgi:hypothetical protein